MTDAAERTRPLDELEQHVTGIEQAENASARRDAFTAMAQNDRLIASLADESADSIAPFLARLRVGRLRSLGATNRFEEAITRARRDLLRTRQADRFNRALANEATLGDTLNDLPDGMEQLRIPQGYVVTPMGVGKIQRNRDGDPETVLITRQPLVITGQGCDIADDTMSISLSWRRIMSRGWVTKTVPRNVICEARLLTEQSIYGAPITSANAKAVVEYLDAFEAANTATMPTVNATKHLGWQKHNGRWMFMLGDMLIQPNDGVEEHLVLFPPSGFRHIADAWVASGMPDTQDAEWSSWCDVWAEGSKHPYAALVVYASVASVLLEALASVPGEKPTPFIVDLSNETSTGKTTILRLAASVWGDPDESGGIITKWSSTIVGTERLAGFLKHLPLFLDESKVANERDVSKILYGICNGRGKTRGAVNGNIRDTATWRLTTLSTGERPLTTFSHDGGILGRTISLTGAPLRGGLAECTNAASVINSGAVNHYGQLGRRVATYLTRHQASWPALKEVWLDTKAKYSRLAKGNVGGRIAGYVALITLAKQICESLGLPKPAVDPIETIIATMRSNAFTNNRPAEAFHVLYSNCIGHAHRFVGTHEHEANREKGASEIWGRWTTHDDSWDGLYILQTVAEQILRRSNIQLHEVLESWKTRGWLHHDKTRSTKMIYLRGLKGGSARTICFNRSAIEQLTAVQLTTAETIPASEVNVPTPSSTLHRPPGDIFRP